MAQGDPQPRADSNLQLMQWFTGRTLPLLDNCDASRLDPDDSGHVRGF